MPRNRDFRPAAGNGSVRTGHGRQPLGILAASHREPMARLCSTARPSCGSFRARPCRVLLLRRGAGLQSTIGKAVLVLDRLGIASASPEAKVRGVKAGISLSAARKSCPSMFLVPGDLARYAEFAERVRQVLRSYSRNLDMTAFGSFHLDFSASKLSYSEFETKLRLMQVEILGTTGLHTSVGAGVSRGIATLAAREHRPCGLRIVAPGTECAFLAPLPIERLRGVGSAPLLALRRRGIHTIGQLQRIPKPALAAALGATAGNRCWNAARGRDDSVAR